MNILNEKAIFVVANYRFLDANNFCDELTKSDSFKEKYSDFQRIRMQFQSNIPLPPEFPVPVALYRNKNTEIIYSLGDARLDISSFSYAEEKERLKDLLFTLSQFKLQEISAIGINYNADCETDKRLSIFNKSISDDTFSNWSKNSGFVVTLPLNLEDLYGCVATYSIKKVKGETDDSGEIVEPYIYNISVNYNFKIDEDKADVMKRLTKLKEIVDSVEKLYKDFEKKCSEITQL